MNANLHDRVPVISRRLLQILACAAVLGALQLPAHADDYTDWLQAHFPVAYGNPALEAAVWGDEADPEGDGCNNLMEFMMARDPNLGDAHLGLRCWIDGDDLVGRYRETTSTNHSVTWIGRWSVDTDFWVVAGVRYEVVEAHAGHRVIEARISRNREGDMFLRLKATNGT